MFARLGRIASRYRWPIVAAWVVAAALITVLAPNIDHVAVNDQRAFLPKHTVSLDAIETVKRYFPDRIAPSSAVVVVDAGAEGSVGSGPAKKFLEDTTAWLKGSERPKVIQGVMSPIGADQQTSQALMSPDRQVALIVVRFANAGTEDVTREAVTAIRQRLDDAPPGVSAGLTGDAPIIGANDKATKDSIDSTTSITIALVVIILLLVYRSPVSPFIPLLTITLAYLISRGVVALLGRSVMIISGYTNIFLIVVLFGAGTDYCLFLISRFREEMADPCAPAAAVERTVTRVGETIASSAGTVVVGLSTMALAELGLFNTTGPSVAIGVVIALLAGLTFAPALLSILGDHAFWPRKPRHMRDGRFWGRWARGVTAHPVIPLVGVLVVLLPLSIYGPGQPRDFNLLQDLPPDTDARTSFDVLATHLGPGTMQPLTVVIADTDGFATPQGLARLERIETAVAGVSEVKTVRGFTGSLRQNKTLSVERQLADQVKAIREGQARVRTLTQAYSTGAKPDPQALQEASAGFLSLYSYLQQLGTQYPEAKADSGYVEAMAALSGLARLSGTTSVSVPASGGPAPTTVDPKLIAALPGAMERLTAGFEHLHTTFASRPDALMLPASFVAADKGLRALREAYLSQDETAARLQVVLDVGPYTPQALTAVDELRTTLQGAGDTVAVEGSTAIIADLKAAGDRDLTRVMIWVLAGVFVVLVLLLRALVAPLYLILTILLSYAATLGIVRVVFEDILGYAGVTWWVPIFMFVMLVALGMDYNIFLMGRVKEEVALSGNREGIRTAVARTGGIITSAGIIMAGTFGAMMSASIVGLVQVGFAVCVGVLLDTFVVRTALVPAIAVILGRWSWWPRRP